jgi:preprotein translocase subunit SecF
MNKFLNQQMIFYDVIIFIAHMLLFRIEIERTNF